MSSDGERLVVRYFRITEDFPPAVWTKALASGLFAFRIVRNGEPLMGLEGLPGEVAGFKKREHLVEVELEPDSSLPRPGTPRRPEPPAPVFLLPVDVIAEPEDKGAAKTLATASQPSGDDQELRRLLTVQRLRAQGTRLPSDLGLGF
jgi:hypothetical protein